MYMQLHQMINYWCSFHGVRPYLFYHFLRWHLQTKNAFYWIGRDEISGCTDVAELFVEVNSTSFRLTLSIHKLWTIHRLIILLRFTSFLFISITIFEFGHVCLCLCVCVCMLFEIKKSTGPIWKIFFSCKGMDCQSNMGYIRSASLAR